MDGPRRRDVIGEAYRLLRHRGDGLAPSARAAVTARLERAVALLAAATPSRPDVDAALAALDATLEAHWSRLRRRLRPMSPGRRSLLILAATVLGLHGWVMDLYRLRSDAMQPTAGDGQLAVVNSFEYGLRPPWGYDYLTTWGTPRRGDVIAFEQADPDGAERVVIRRVVAVAGDRVRVVGGRLVLGDVPVPTERVGERACRLDLGDGAEVRCPCVQLREHAGAGSYLVQRVATPAPDGSSAPCVHQADWPGAAWPPVGERQDTPGGPDVVVPAGAVFVLGDHRDRARDGRAWGLVTQERIRGRVVGVL